MASRDSEGVHIGDAAIWLLSLAVIAWALSLPFKGDGAPLPSPTLDACIRAGYVETSAGPVFCTLIAEN